VYLLDTQGNPLFIYTLIYASFIVAFYFSLKRITNNRIALIFTFIIAFTFEIFDHSLLSYTNLPYSAFLLLGYLYFINYVKDTKLSSLILASLLIGLSGWIRSSDPFWIPALLLMIYESIKNKKFNHLAMFIAIILTIRLPWNYFVSEISKGYSVTSSNNFNLIFTTSISKYIDRLFLVIPYVWINVIKPQLSVYLMFVLTLLMYIPKPSRVLTITRLLILINLCVIIGGVYFYSIVYEKWQVIGNSVTRMSIFMTPLILIAVAITVSHKYSNLFSNEK
jgi:4-amino-4-deoxy-L-arabinose transferase-like glycosyltransferase